ncbi:uncharacterized protein [Diadema antillarum]|uniref:uncharacterized protein n=1 Tax=Diadema antillarum TaxID=105358 RepID=UPI003A8984B3
MAEDGALLNGDHEVVKKSVRAAPAHPKYIDMVVDAIKQLDEKKGASVIAVKQWIMQTYPEIDQARLKGQLKMAITKGVASGIIVRPKKSEGMGTLTGRYKLGKPPKPPAKKAAKKKAATTKKRPKSPAKKERKQSDPDVFDYSEASDGNNEEDRPTKSQKKGGKSGRTTKAAPRPRSASATATPKAKTSKSKLIRRSRSHSPIPSKLKSAVRSTSKSPAKKTTSKSPGKKAAASKRSPQAKAKPKKVAAKKDGKPSASNQSPKKKAKNATSTKASKK